MGPQDVEDFLDAVDRDRAAAHPQTVSTRKGMLVHGPDG
jgi:hypothetical protein